MTASCPHVRDLLMESLDEPLGQEEQGEVDTHFGECGDCVEYLTEWVRIAEVLRDLEVYEALEAPVPLSEELVQRILTARRAAATGGIVERGTG